MLQEWRAVNLIQPETPKVKFTLLFKVKWVLGFYQVLASQAAGAIAKWLFTNKTYKGEKGTVYIGSNYPV